MVFFVNLFCSCCSYVTVNFVCGSLPSDLGRKYIWAHKSLFISSAEYVGLTRNDPIFHNFHPETLVDVRRTIVFDERRNKPVEFLYSVSELKLLGSPVFAHRFVSVWHIILWHRGSLYKRTGLMMHIGEVAALISQLFSGLLHIEEPP